MFTIHPNNRFLRFINFTLYAIDCITYVTSFITLFIFITLVSYVGEKHISFTDPLLSTIIGIQIVRPLIIYFLNKKNIKDMVKELGVTFILCFLFVIYIIINALPNRQNIQMIHQLSLITHLFLHITYLTITRYRVQHFITSFKLSIFRSFVTSFFFLIVFGTWLLSLPAARTGFIPFIDIFFSVTSAVTVTGLSTVNLGADFTMLGQFIFIILIQVGGLGIITFSTFFLLSTKQRLGYEERHNALAVFNQQEMTGVKKIVYTVLISTIIIEGLGAVLIFIQMPYTGYSSMATHWFYSFFFSVAAFCNAGFSLFPNSLVSFANYPSLLYTITAITLLGGLGFIIFLELGRKMKHFFYRKKNHRSSFSLFSKLIIVMTIALTLIGFIGFIVLEWNASLANLSTADKFHNAFFQGVHSRIGGFNSVDPSQIKAPTIILMDALMFIGGSPGSTAGGLKITTFCVLVIAMFNLLSKRNMEQIKFFKYKISHKTLYKAFSILFLRILLTIIGIFILSINESYLLFHQLLFETISALSNTGYGISSIENLSPISKITISILMFIGRLGSFYLFSTLFYSKRKNSTIEYKEVNLPLE